MILVNNLVVIRFLPWSDRLGYFLYIYGRILTRNAETSMTNNYQIYVCVFFSRNSFVGYKKNIVYLQREFEIKTLAKDQRIHFIYYVQNIHFPFLVVFIRL